MKNEDKKEPINEILENSNKNLNFAFFIFAVVFLFIFGTITVSYITNLNSRIKFLEDNNKLLMDNNLNLEAKLLDFILAAQINVYDINQTSTNGNNTNNLYKNDNKEKVDEKGE